MNGLRFRTVGLSGPSSNIGVGIFPKSSSIEDTRGDHRDGNEGGTTFDNNRDDNNGNNRDDNDDEDDMSSLDSTTMVEDPSDTETNIETTTKESMTTTRIIDRERIETEEAIALLQHYSSNDKEPLGLLNQYYQKRGVGNLHSYFVETFVAGSRTFTYSFVCPLTGAAYESGLPRPVFYASRLMVTDKASGGNGGGGNGVLDSAADSKENSVPLASGGSDCNATAPTTTTTTTSATTALPPTSPTTTPYETLLHLSEGLFGEHTIGNGTIRNGVGSGRVSFGTKKRAKKALALAVLEDIEPITRHVERPFVVPLVGYHSPSDDGLLQQSMDNGDGGHIDNHDKSTSAPVVVDGDDDDETDVDGTEPQTERGGRNVPSWCHSLYDVGVSDVNLFYEQYIPDDNENDSKNHTNTNNNTNTSSFSAEPWKGKPTLLRCIAESNRNVTIVGPPSLTRNEAKESAAKALVDKVTKQRVGGLGGTGGVVPRKRRRTFPDSEYVRYWKPLPKWATVPFSNGVDNTVVDDSSGGDDGDDEEGETMRSYLYRLTFFSPTSSSSKDVNDNNNNNNNKGDIDGDHYNHHSFLNQRMGLQNITPMGILFPYDLPSPPPPPSSTAAALHQTAFRATFPIVPRGKRKPEGTLAVELSRVSTSSSSPSSPSSSTSSSLHSHAVDLTKDQIRSLEEFNMRLCTWHLDYSAGCIRRMVSEAGKRTVNERDPCGRTYLFVPLVRRGRELRRQRTKRSKNNRNCGDGGDGEEGNEYNVDFDLIRRVVTNEFEPFLGMYTVATVCHWFCAAVWISWGLVLLVVVVLLMAIVLPPIYVYVCERLGLDLLPPTWTNSTTLMVSITTFVQALVTDNHDGNQKLLIQLKPFLLVFLVSSIMALYLHRHPPLRPRFSTDTMANHFFIEQGKKHGQMDVHVLPKPPPHRSSSSNTTTTTVDRDNYWHHDITGRSRYYPHGPPPNLSRMELARNRVKYGIDLVNASYTEVYRKKFGLALKYPYGRLVGCSRVTKHGDRDLLFRSSPTTVGVWSWAGASSSKGKNNKDDDENEKNDRSYLFPEMVRLLPLPRDFVYIFGQASRFMPPLEREICLRYTAETFRTEIEERAPFPLLDGCVLPPLNCSGQDVVKSELGNEEAKIRRRCLPPTRYGFENLLGYATEPGPHMERLEFLGDSVLGYFVGLNEFALNFSLKWDSFDMRDIHCKAICNKTLDEAGQAAGIGEIFWPKLFYWRSYYAEDEASVQRCNALRRDREAKGLPFPKGRVTFRMGNKTMSDAVEALLAACYLHDRGWWGGVEDNTNDRGKGSAVVGLMESLDLPLPHVEEEDEAAASEACRHRWFSAMSSCMNGGYAFDLDSGWSATIDAVGNSLAAAPTEVSNALRNGRRGLVKVLAAGVPDPVVFEHALECDRAKVLLECALYDDSRADEANLVDCALLRDSLHRVGHEALSLSISSEIFRRFPSASERDMTVQRLSAYSHDVVVYIMFKSNVRRFLFDQSTTSLLKFQALAEDADLRGEAKWRKGGGWILGEDEFYRRRDAARLEFGGWVRSEIASYDRGRDDPPRYMGIGGGRLVGQQKIDESITEDLSFSMKTIVGALVLAMGVDGMWSCIRPLWEETMMLSAEEIRQHFGTTSSAVMNYWKAD